MDDISCPQCYKYNIFQQLRDKTTNSYNLHHEILSLGVNAENRGCFIFLASPDHCQSSLSLSRTFYTIIMSTQLYNSTIDPTILAQSSYQRQRHNSGTDTLWTKEKMELASERPIHELPACELWEPENGWAINNNNN